jgi:hypothetical protein
MLPSLVPPYHCQYNPIELIWAQAKREAADRNIFFLVGRYGGMREDGTGCNLKHAVKKKLADAQ